MPLVPIISGVPLSIDDVKALQVFGSNTDAVVEWHLALTASYIETIKTTVVEVQNEITNLETELGVKHHDNSTNN